MAIVTALAKKTDSGDERAELKRAVADAHKARAAVDRQREAIERGKQLVQEAQAKLAAAGGAVVAAREKHAQHIAAAIAGGSSSPASTPGAIRAARAVERDCEDDIEAAKTAAASLESDLVDMETDASAAGRAVDTAVAATLKPVVARLLDEARACHLRFLMMREALNAMGRTFNPWDGGDLTKLIDRVGTASEADVRVSIAVRKEWDAAIAALGVDASTELPTIEASRP
jgi:chromosome segregation ATPase